MNSTQQHKLMGERLHTLSQNSRVINVLRIHAPQILLLELVNDLCKYQSIITIKGKPIWLPPKSYHTKVPNYFYSHNNGMFDSARENEQFSPQVF